MVSRPCFWAGAGGWIVQCFQCLQALRLHCHDLGGGEGTFPLKAIPVGISIAQEESLRSNAPSLVDLTLSMYKNSRTLAVVNLEARTAWVPLGIFQVGSAGP